MNESLILAAADLTLYRWGATALAAVAVFGAVLSLRLPMRQLIQKQEADFHGALVELFLFDVTPRQLTYVMFAGARVAGVLLALFAFHSDGGGLAIVAAFVVGTVSGYWVPRVVIFVMQRRRRQRLNDQLIDGLVTLANGMRAGLNLVQSMKLIETNAQPPISQEFGLMLREFEHGTSVDEVMRRASVRIKLHHYKLLFAAMETARQRGGNLPETLDRLGESLREILRLEEKVKALTAENRMSARMMGAMPAVIGGIYYMIEPDWVGAILNSQWGLLLLLIALVFWVVGFLWIRKIMTFEI
ncbi:MAG: type II secretion system F family protein [Planctomycetota bacterium]|nr:type II secretion system F family protein [Planctomycetota bacterium]